MTTPIQAVKIEPGQKWLDRNGKEATVLEISDGANESGNGYVLLQRPARKSRVHIVNFRNNYTPVLPLRKLTPVLTTPAEAISLRERETRQWAINGWARVCLLKELKEGPRKSYYVEMDLPIWLRNGIERRYSQGQ